MRFTLLVAALALFLTFALLAPARPFATADEGMSPETWTFDVRAVRVDASSPDIVEKHAPWEVDAQGREVASPAVDLPWTKILAALKERGQTTILVDQQLTGVKGQEVDMIQNRDHQVRTFQGADINNERWIGSVVSTGTKAKLLVGDVFEYEAEVRWAHSTKEPIGGLPTGMVRWRGSYAVESGETLVLHHRNQKASPGVESNGIELYVFLTARRAR